MIQIKNEFKTIQFALFFTDYDEKDTRVYRFLLPKLLISHSNTYKTKTLMQKKLEDLYGARLYTRSERHANLNVMSFMLTIVDPVIVDDHDLINQSIALLNDIFVDRSYFDEDIFMEEKRLLIEQWETLKDHKRVYANVEFGKAFFGDDLSAYPMSGTLEDIKKLTLDDVISYYQKKFYDNEIKIIINGHIDEHIQTIKDSLLIKAKSKDFDIEFKFRDVKTLNQIQEETKMNQAILKLGYHLPIFRFDPLYEAALCVDTILGGYPESRLFKEIREKQGLCYDVSSNFDFYKGVLIVSSGVSKLQKDYALEEIIKEVDRLKIDKVDLEELSYAKAYLVHQIKSSLDSQSYLTKRQYFRDIFNDQTPTEKRIENILNVSLEVICQVIDMIKLDTTYVLYGGAL
ncbi:MAG: pitrilysin family protein [Acholeplasmataceae bacterium]